MALDRICKLDRKSNRSPRIPSPTKSCPHRIVRSKQHTPLPVSLISSHLPGRLKIRITPAGFLNSRGGLPAFFASAAAEAGGGGGGGAADGAAASAFAADSLGGGFAAESLGGGPADSLGGGLAEGGGFGGGAGAFSAASAAVIFAFGSCRGGRPSLSLSLFRAAKAPPLFSRAAAAAFFCLSFFLSNDICCCV